jgi:hypothetical protein
MVITPEVIRINPEYADSYYNRGIAHRELGNDVKAMADELGYKPPDDE